MATPPVALVWRIPHGQRSYGRVLQPMGSQKDMTSDSRLFHDSMEHHKMRVAGKEKSQMISYPYIF